MSDSLSWRDGGSDDGAFAGAVWRPPPGILILVMPRLLNYIVAIYLIAIGIIGLGLFR